MNINTIQNAMQQEAIDSWLIYDFQATNPVMARFFKSKKMLTRRLFLLIPRTGEPQFLASRIDHDAVQLAPYAVQFYVSWQEMEQKLTEMLAESAVVAMDYSPGGVLPTVSRADAGTVEMVRAMDKQVVSAANLFQAVVAVWSAETLAAHREDCQRVAEIKDAAFSFIADQLQAGRAVTEFDVQTTIMNHFEAANLTTPYPPIVAANAHSGDPHYSPTPEKAVIIRPHDWVLIDLWAKRPGYQYVFADMTWVAVAAEQPTSKQQTVFNAVAAARDEAVSFLQQQVTAGVPVEGWQVDDVARQQIVQAGYGEYFFHRTGHSLGPGDTVHGMGVNIDNLETHDTRRLQPGIGFSIEPGIYLPEFGVRLEIDVYMAETGPLVTTPIQREIICLLE